MPYIIFRDQIAIATQDTEPTAQEMETLNASSYEYREDHQELEQNKARLKQALISAQFLSLIDIQWVSFSDQEIGDIIVHRVFGGNPHAQMAMMAKIMSITMKQMMWETPSSQEMEILAKSEESKTQINEMRAKFNLQVIS